MVGFLGYGRQSVDDEDVAAVVAALKSDFLTQGPLIERFESQIAQTCGARHAIAVANGTAALHIACLAAGARAGTLGLTQPLTFAATANALLYCGADVGLVDVDPDSLTMSPEGLAAELARRPEAKIVLPVSYSGLASHGPALRKAAGDRAIIEDASHSFGATDETGKPVGSGGWADMTTFSFHPVKPITTGEGGAVVTNDDELARRLRLLRSHGIERDVSRFEEVGHEGDPWYHEQQILGYNYRLTDIQAALGASQARKVDRLIARRRVIASLYDRAFADEPAIGRPLSRPDQRARSGHHLYLILLDFARLGRSRGEVMGALRAKGIGAQVHYIPVHRHPYHRARFAGARFPVSEAFYDKALSIPCYPDMSDADVDRVAAAILAIVRG